MSFIELAPEQIIPHLQLTTCGAGQCPVGGHSRPGRDSNHPAMSLCRRTRK